MRPVCKHCQKHVGTRPRGLCHRCYLDVTIRKSYPPLSVMGTYAADYEEREPTEEEVEKMIAEQLPTMPGEMFKHPPRQLPQILKRNLLARKYR